MTQAAGLAVEMYGLGATAADYDNDGKVDLYVTGLGGNQLFRNLGGGKFADVTAKAGVADAGFGTSATFFDYDKDGRLDLLGRQLRRVVDREGPLLHARRQEQVLLHARVLQGPEPAALPASGDGTFEDATQKAGLLDPRAKALGLSLLDFDDDGWPDLFVANDTQPNKLFSNNGDGTFTDVGMAAGVAFGETGVARAGMGIDAGDYDGTGRPRLVIGNFSNEMMALYHNEGNGLFIDEAPSSTIGQASLLTLTFAAFFFDYDLDGRLDIFAVNGHVADDIQTVQPKVSYAQPPHLFRNLGGKKFEAVIGKVGPDLARPMVARGAAYARLRRRRRPRPGGHRQRRPGACCCATTAATRTTGCACARRHEVEPGRHRRQGDGHARGRRQELGRREDRLELLLAERAAAHLRARHGRQGRGHRGVLAERAARQARPAARRPHGHVTEGAGAK